MERNENDATDGLDETTSAQAVAGPDDTAEAVDEISRLLPGAIAQASRQSGRLCESLRPSVVRALRITAQEDPRVLVDALFRVIVPAFFRAVVERIRSLALHLNHFLLRNASIHGLRWRMEALRTGRPLRDIVRQHTSSKQVKQVFLIHRETGLLLASARQEDVAHLDGDMISAMLTAIQDFVQDSFGVPRRTGLEHIQVGSTQVWIERGEHAVLAGIIEGQATRELRELFHESLLRIHSDFQRDLRQFQGDARAFKAAQLYLDSCVNAKLTEAGERLLPLTWLVLAAPVLAVTVLGGLRLRDVLIWNGYVDTIARQPGIVVLESGVHHGRFFIRGLRDPLALDPAAMLPAATLNRDAVDSEWHPFQALIPEWSLLRARQLLSPPDTVTLDIEGSTLRLNGSAPGEWIDDARRLSRFLPGVSHLDVSRLVDRDQQSKGAWKWYLARLRSEPGIVVTEHEESGGMFLVAGLRDAAAADPAALLAEAGLDPSQVRGSWSFYASPVPRFALARAQRILAPPVTTQLKMEGATLVAEGEASHRWIRDAVLLARGIEGISSFDTDRLVDVDMREFRVLKQEIESVQFRFLDRGTALGPGQARALRQLGERLASLNAMGRKMGVDVFVEIRGHVLDARNEEEAQSESLVMTQRFTDILQRQDVDTRRILQRGLGAEMPAGSGPPRADQPKRAVTVSVSSVQH